MEPPRLRAAVDFHAQRVGVLPGDVQTLRLRHDNRGVIPLTLISGRFVLRRIPRIGNLFGRLIQRNADVVASRRDHHAETPVLRDHGDPVAGQIKGRIRLSRRWRTALLSFTPATLGMSRDDHNE